MSWFAADWLLRERSLFRFDATVACSHDVGDMNVCSFAQRRCGRSYREKTTKKRYSCGDCLFVVDTAHNERSLDVPRDSCGRVRRRCNAQGNSAVGSAQSLCVSRTSCSRIVSYTLTFVCGRCKWKRCCSRRRSASLSNRVGRFYIC